MSAAMVKEVAWREIRTRARTKSFKWITGILVLAAIAGPVIAAVLPDGSGNDLRDVTIGLVGVDSSIEDQNAAFTASGLAVEFRDLAGSSPEQVEQALADGEIDLALEPGPTLVWNRGTDFEIAGVVYAVLQQQELLVLGVQ